MRVCNKQVSKLVEALDAAKHQLLSVKQEYAAFRKHSEALLKTERDLNAKLRHLQENGP